MLNICCCSVTVTKTGMSRQILVKFPNIKYNENLFSGSRDFYMRTEKHGEANE
jgi:hypothetical protein